ncbi:hypothetical protein LTR53_016135 [Teratosphaeriaceae sp. CCFEE 6253]|nr:hypothetical protein LTR53_016135 [Teratosphaeriaceae sp. CCFEE 6253]
MPPSIEEEAYKVCIILADQINEIIYVVDLDCFHSFIADMAGGLTKARLGGQDAIERAIMVRGMERLIGDGFGVTKARYEDKTARAPSALIAITPPNVIFNLCKVAARSYSAAYRSTHTTTALRYALRIARTYKPTISLRRVSYCADSPPQTCSGAGSGRVDTNEKTRSRSGIANMAKAEATGVNPNPVNRTETSIMSLPLELRTVIYNSYIQDARADRTSQSGATVPFELTQCCTTAEGRQAVCMERLPILETTLQIRDEFEPLFLSEMSFTQHLSMAVRWLNTLQLERAVERLSTTSRCRMRHLHIVLCDVTQCTKWALARFANVFASTKLLRCEGPMYVTHSYEFVAWGSTVTMGEILGEVRDFGLRLGRAGYTGFDDVQLQVHAWLDVTAPFAGRTSEHREMLEGLGELLD